MSKSVPLNSICRNTAHREVECSLFNIQLRIAVQFQSLGLRERKGSKQLLHSQQSQGRRCCLPPDRAFFPVASTPIDSPCSTCTQRTHTHTVQIKHPNSQVKSLQHPHSSSCIAQARARGAILGELFGAGPQDTQSLAALRAGSSACDTRAKAVIPIWESRPKGIRDKSTAQENTPTPTSSNLSL